MSFRKFSYYITGLLYADDGFLQWTPANDTLAPVQGLSVTIDDQKNSVAEWRINRQEGVVVLFIMCIMCLYIDLPSTSEVASSNLSPGASC